MSMCHGKRAEPSFAPFQVFLPKTESSCRAFAGDVVWVITCWRKCQAVPRPHGRQRLRSVACLRYAFQADADFRLMGSRCRLDWYLATCNPYIGIFPLILTVNYNPYEGLLVEGEDIPIHTSNALKVPFPPPKVRECSPIVTTFLRNL